jgi:2-polyprenyl-6-methoxyphenol hydroxylase-like FAD-dependent oxidoreductase
MNILVVGAGVAGPTLAFWLHRFGFQPTLLERAPAPRTGGYIVDFWGAGFDVADRMGVLPAILERGYQIREVRLVGDDGRRVGGFGADVFGQFMSGRFTSVRRSDIAQVVMEALDPSIEQILGDELASLEAHADGVEVTLRRGGRRRFDLVIGADGLHSSVRSLAFSGADRSEKFLGYEVAAFMVDGYPRRDDLVYVLHSDPGRQVGRFAMRDDRTLFLFVWARDEVGVLPTEPRDQIAYVTERFRSARWECPAILEAIRDCPEPYLDRVSQVRMDRWAQGRVALVGDAAYCVSLLAGQGTALAMVGAYVLAGELHAAAGNHEVAFAAYERRLGAFLKHKQQAAERFASSFAPRTELGVWMRNQVTNVLSIQWIAELAIGRDLRDLIELPSYETT